VARFVEVDLGLNRIVKELSLLSRKNITVGIHDPKNAQIGFYQEFGTKSKFGKKQHIPPTPFLRISLMGKKLENFKIITAKAVDDLIMGSSATTVCNNIGSYQSTVIKQGIQGKIFKPNRPSTIKRKGFDYRLVEKGNLLNSIKHKVV
jgi:hypothetical protein